MSESAPVGISNRMRILWCLVFSSAIVPFISTTAIAQVEIPVVTKWQHLLNAPKIKTEWGQIRLGISSHSPRQNSGFLIYCLTDGFEPNGRVVDRSVGPVRYRLDYGGLPIITERIKALTELSQKKDYRDATLLFCQSVAVTRTGEARLKIFLGPNRKKTIAVAKILPLKSAAHPWIPFQSSQQLHSLPVRDGKYDAVATVQNEPDGFAIPNYAPASPLIYQIKRQGKHQHSRFDPMSLLPNLLPAGFDQQLTIRQTSKGIAMTSKSDICLSNPRSFLLARWWINGKPFVPEANQRSEAESINGKLITGRKLHLIFDYSPISVGATDKDKVEVQFLYCSHGWKRGDFSAEKLMPQLVSSAAPMLVSNRIELKPGD